MKKLNESASAGTTSAGAIASTPTGLNNTMIRRIPPTNIYGGYSPVTDPVKKDEKKKK